VNTVLVIAGSDSSGGAGIARDLQTLRDHGTRGVYALTAVTAQTDARVLASELVPAAVIRAQLQAAFESAAIGAVKIGMLGSREAVLTVAEVLRAHPGIPVVLDPVLASSSGTVLLDEPGRQALQEELLPLAGLFTPNIPEAAILLGAAAATDEQGMLSQARSLQRLGPRAVLLKGGHAAGVQATDILIDQESVVLLKAERLPGSCRGTGCALASSVAASLAAGVPLEASCRAAKRYVTGLLHG
jgi:hydroxymethylpyrimidine/phosphomethylpyrimidine kinase